MGRELARMLVRAGCRVAATGRRAGLLDTLRAEHPSILTATLDVTRTAELEAGLDALATRLGGVDLLILSAGTGDENPGLDFGIEKTAIDTNVSGFTCICDWAFRYFVSTGAGHLAAITSVAGLRGNRQAPAYNATKAYQVNYLEGLRQRARAAKLPIAVTDIRPGFVDTAMAKGDGLFWVAPVGKAARQIMRAIGHRRRVVYVTRRWRVVAAIFRVIPAALYEKM